MNMRLALLFQDNNFIGREYFRGLQAAGITPDILVALGRMSEKSIAIECERTAGKWNPPPLPADLAVSRFNSLQVPDLWKVLRDAHIDVAIQGGIGILKPEMLQVPRIGFLNVHPGRLPQYRGNSCPEWALHNRNDIYATAHIIDEGIDTGPIICEQRYRVPPEWDYFDLRANLYAHCTEVLVEALNILDAARDDPNAVLTTQQKDSGHYWPPIPEDKLSAVITSLQSRAK